MARISSTQIWAAVITGVFGILAAVGPKLIDLYIRSTSNTASPSPQTTNHPPVSPPAPTDQPKSDPTVPPEQPIRPVGVTVIQCAILSGRSVGNLRVGCQFAVKNTSGAQLELRYSNPLFDSYLLDNRGVRYVRGDTRLISSGGGILESVQLKENEEVTLQQIFYSDSNSNDIRSATIYFPFCSVSTPVVQKPS
jgi:hypothetical protein